MNKEEIREYLIDFQKNEIPNLIERDLNIEESNKIITIMGPRRAGKTYFLYQKIKELLKNEIKKEKIVYLNFENPRLIDINFKELKEITKLHWEIYPTSTKENLHIFIDEPQNIKNWEFGVRELHDEGHYVYLTGSSSKLLSKEIATSLRGRSLSYLLLPSSFKEFLKMKNLDFDIERLSSKERALMKNSLNEYMEFGGFPEIIIEKNDQTKSKIIDSYFNLVVYKDIVDRYKIKNTNVIKWLITALVNSFSKEFSVNKIYLTLKSKGIKVSKNTLYTYLSMLEDSFFIFVVPKFEFSNRKREFSINKVYLSDIGFTKIIETTKNFGGKMENIVFLELERRRSALTTISYWKNQQKEEVDFIVKQGTKITNLIQVCYSVEDVETKKRELRALLKASREVKCNKLFVITSEYEDKEVHQNKNVYFIPLWKWLLKQKKYN